MTAVDDPVVQDAMRNRRWSFWLQLVALPLSLALAIGVVAYATQQENDFNDRAVTVEATVVDVIETKIATEIDAAEVTLRWQLPNSSETTQVTKVMASPPAKGDKLMVRYDPRKAEDVYIGESGSPDYVFFSVIVMIFVCLMALIVSLFAMDRVRQTRRMQRILQATHWRGADVEKWVIGLRHQQVLMVRAEGEQHASLFERKFAVGQSLLASMESAMVYEVASITSDEIILRSPGVSRLSLCKPYRLRSHPLLRRRIRKLGAASPLMASFNRLPFDFATNYEGEQSA